MDIPDEDLAQAAAAGDRQAFCILMERLYDRFFCYELSPDRAAYRSRRLDAGYLHQTARKINKLYSQSPVFNIAVPRHRECRPRPTATAGATGNTIAWLGRLGTGEKGREPGGSADNDWLVSAMQSLATELRETLALVLDDVSHKDAAQILGVSQGTISWRVADAKARLRGLRAREQTR
jgi:RNA polymerase sigma-70 factor (ECF subfamily)